MNTSTWDRVLIAGAALFASWTLYCYAIVLSGLGFHDLMSWSFLPVIGGVLLTLLCTRNSTVASNRSGMTSAGISLAASRRNPYNALLGILTVTMAILFYADAEYWIVWALLLCISLLVTRICFATEASDPIPQQPGSRREGIAVAALAIFCALLTAITHRPDLDDSQYLNFIVTALDFPVEPLFSHSGIWADRSVPLELSLYRFHSYELLIAALTSVTGIEHKVFYYLIFPPLCAAAAALVYWRLARHLAPRHAPLIVLVWVVLIVAMGESHRVLGNFAFVRLFQGKSLLVTLALPFCTLIGLKFSEAPGAQRALALAVAVIASLGLSSSALITVPVILAVALVVAVLGASHMRARLAVAVGLVAILIVVAITAYMFSPTHVGDGAYADVERNAGTGLTTMLGEGLVGTLVLALFPLAPLFVSGYRRRKIYATTTLVYVTCVLIPFVSPFFAQNFDLAVQWRLFWAVPFLISAALAIAGLAALLRQWTPQPLRPVVVPVLLAAVLAASTLWSVSPGNNVVYAFPQYKVEPAEYAVAAEIARIAPAQSNIYAPISVAGWIPTFRHHAYPLVVRLEYIAFGRTKKHVGVRELERRLRVIRYLEGEDTHPYTALFFLDQLAVDQPSVVVYSKHVFLAEVIKASLVTAGYSGKLQGDYWLWRRD